MKLRPLAIALAASASLVGNQAAAQDCISEAEISGLAIYAIPLVVDGVQGKCEGQLSASGFLATSGADFSAPYLLKQDEVWPAARSGFMHFAKKGDDAEGDDLLNGLPDEALRPLFDLIIVQKVGESVAIKDCSKVERALELIAPLPPENTGGLVAMLGSLVGKEDPKVCESE